MHSNVAVIILNYQVLLGLVVWLVCLASILEGKKDVTYFTIYFTDSIVIQESMSPEKKANEMCKSRCFIIY